MEIFKFQFPLHVVHKTLIFCHLFPFCSVRYIIMWDSDFNDPCTFFCLVPYHQVQFDCSIFQVSGCWNYLFLVYGVSFTAGDLFMLMFPHVAGALDVQALADGPV